MTNMIYRIPFQEAHLYMMQMREHEASLIDFEETAIVAEDNKWHTFMYDGRIIGIAGFIRVFEGVGSVFLLPSVYIGRCAKTFLKYVREYIHETITTNGFHRLQTASRADEQTDRFMQAIGFTCEGTLVKYTSSQVNYRMWARYE